MIDFFKLFYSSLPQFPIFKFICTHAIFSQNYFSTVNYLTCSQC